MLTIALTKYSNRFHNNLLINLPPKIFLISFHYKISFFIFKDLKYLELFVSKFFSYKSIKKVPII